MGQYVYKGKTVVPDEIDFQYWMVADNGQANLSLTGSGEGRYQKNSFYFILPGLLSATPY